MAWSDQCKIAFATTVKTKRLMADKKRSARAVILEISKESDIPTRTLQRWWTEFEEAKKCANNGANSTTHQEHNENKVEQKPEVEQRPTCHCGRPAKPGKVKADGTRSYYSQCQKCLRAANSSEPYQLPQRPQLDDAVTDIVNTMKALESKFMRVAAKLQRDDILNYVAPSIKERFDKAENNLRNWTTKARGRQKEPDQCVEGEIGAPSPIEEFEKAYEAFYRQVQNAKLEKWANISKETCSKMVKWINDLIEV